MSELRAVDEITPELYRLIAPFFTVWPAEGSKINLLTAPPEVLAALNEDDALEPLSAQQIARIIELRDGGMLNEVDIRETPDITGSLPTQIGHWTAMSDLLLLYDTSIGHRLPTELGSLSNMRGQLKMEDRKSVV